MAVWVCTAEEFVTEGVRVMFMVVEAGWLEFDPPFDEFALLSGTVCNAGVLILILCYS